MKKNLKIEAEGGELILKNKIGDHVIIPKDRREEVQELIKHGCHGCIDGIVESLPSMAEYAEDGTVVSQLYTQKTGKDWSTAKKEGLTDGSYEQNIKLLADLKSGKYDSSAPINPAPVNKTTKPVVTNTSTNPKLPWSTAGDFHTASKIARSQLGPNQIFEWNGKKYGTNVPGETLNPSEETLKNNGLYNELTMKRLEQSNKMVQSLYSTKKVVKLEPTWEDWEDIKKRSLEENNIKEVDKINSYQSSFPDEDYLVLDKNLGKLHLYRGGKEISSYNVGVGENTGDDLTMTKEHKDGPTEWLNRSTGAGVFTTFLVNPNNEHYPDHNKKTYPSWHFKDIHGNSVPMSLHNFVGNRDVDIMDDDPYNNRITAGCINGVCKDLSELYKKGFGKGEKIYVLPDKHTENSFELVDGKLQLVTNNPKVSGVLKQKKDMYKPINIETDATFSSLSMHKLSKEDVISAGPLTSGLKFLKEEITARDNASKIGQTLSKNKEQLMKDLNLSNSAYNDLALTSLGVIGVESEYGTSMRYHLKNNEDLQNYIKDKVGNTSYNSRGLGQMKYDGHIKNPEIKSLYDKYGITRDNLDDPEKAALAEMIYLNHILKNEVPNYKYVEDVSDIDKLLYLYNGNRKELFNKTATPDKNIYIQNVNSYKNLFKLQQLD